MKDGSSAGALRAVAEVRPLHPPAGAARPRRRHLALLLGFLLLVAAPVCVSAAYLHAVAKDQYASRVGFTVRREDAGSAVELFGGVANLSGSAGSDTDMLFEFIRSPQMVRRVDEALDLRALYAVPGDPVFALAPDASIEAMTRYWQRVVKVFHDSGSGLIELRVQAFDPETARQVAEAILAESSAMVNALSQAAREDATRHTALELDRSVERLVAARQGVTEFRTRSRIVDPAADIQSRMGLLSTLEAQLAEAMIELDLLRETTRESDPRIRQSLRRIDVIEARIDAERNRFGLDGAPGPGGGAYATLVAEYERLAVDLEFAEKAYLSALAAHDAAQAEARRQSRYLAAYIPPTRPETPEYPQRGVLLAMVGLFALIGWAILVMTFYSLRDRK